MQQAAKKTDYTSLPDAIRKPHLRLVPKEEPPQESTQPSDDYYIRLFPEMAAALGEKRALFIQRLHYWLEKSTHVIGDRKWCYNTYEDWHRDSFPFWSVRTIKRVVKSLVKDGLIKIDRFSYGNRNRTNWYTINYNVLEKYLEAKKRHKTVDATEIATCGKPCGKPVENSSKPAENQPKSTPQNQGYLGVDSDSLAQSDSDSLAQSKHNNTLTNSNSITDSKSMYNTKRDIQASSTLPSSIRGSKTARNLPIPSGRPVENPSESIPQKREEKPHCNKVAKGNERYTEDEVNVKKNNQTKLEVQTKPEVQIKPTAKKKPKKVNTKDRSELRRIAIELNEIFYARGQVLFYGKPTYETLELIKDLLENMCFGYESVLKRWLEEIAKNWYHSHTRDKIIAWQESRFEQQLRKGCYIQPDGSNFSIMLLRTRWRDEIYHEFMGKYVRLMLGKRQK